MKHLTRFLLPDYCTLCDSPLDGDEEFFCLHCLSRLALVGWPSFTDNPMTRLLWEQDRVERAASGFYYRRSSSHHQILMDIKYNSRPEVGRRLASLIIGRLHRQGFFEGIDSLVPVPLSPSHSRERGYNQSLWICQGISQVTGIPIVADVLLRSGDGKSQTRLSGVQRALNSHSDFHTAHPELIRGSHILIIDDVFTSGATMKACINALRQSVPDCRISAFTLGYSGS